MPLTQQDIQQQLDYIYSQLAVKLNARNFRLIVKVHQLSAAFARGISAAEMHGFCHGYNEYWAKHLLENNRLTVPNTLQDNLPEFLELTPEIMALQQQRNFRYTLHKVVSRQVKYFAQLDPLLRYIVKPMYEDDHAKNKMLVIGLGEMPKFSYLPSFRAAIIRHNPALLHKWHEVRLYRDKEGYMHWFDANIGWFKSKQSGIANEELITCLSGLFEILQYADFKVAAIFANFKPRHLEEREGFEPSIRY
jgi:hypothetical protein